MDLEHLRQEEYAIANWSKLRPFYVRLSPEYIWGKVRAHILEEVLEELQAVQSNNYEYPTFFTYPSQAQVEAAHEAYRMEGLFMSEIREIIGYRAAEALTTLAGLIRLETKGSALNTLQQCFDNLWENFSSYSYSRGYRTHIVRSNLIMMLCSNNVLEIPVDKTWQQNMLEYFLTGENEWTRVPHKKAYKGVIKMLGGQPDWLPDDKSILYKGLLDLDNLPEDEISPFCRSLYWEQGVPENDLHLPGMMEHHARRGDSQPTSEFYEIPFHMISVKCERFEKMHEKILADPFEKSVIHLCLCLSYRNRIAEQMRIGNMFRFEDVAKKCNISIYSSKMVVGQMIKVGLIEFDKFSGKTWHDESQEFVLTSLATNLIANKIPS